MQKVLVVGGGFGGIKAALELAENANFTVTLLSERPSFYYYPGLYHTATGGRRAETDIPLVDIFDRSGVEIVTGKATTLDREARVVKTNDGQQLPYDVVILSLGVVTSYFGIPGIAEHSYGIKSIEEAERFKKHLHEQLLEDHKPDVNYVVVGGGPTGIELAGNLTKYLRHVMKKHGIKHRAVHVSLVEAMPKLLPRLPKKTSSAVKKRLRSLGVTLHIGEAVEAATAESITIGGKVVPSHSIIWTAGMANNPFFKENNFALSQRGKVLIDEHLAAEPNIYVIGDNAETQYSGMAQTALHDALFVTENLKRNLGAQSPKPYSAKQPITVIPCGPDWAAVVWGKVQLSGRIGWWLREAADVIAFRDIEPWWRASAHFLTEFGEEESCPACHNVRK